MKTIQTCDIKKLKPWPCITRLHTPEQVKQLVCSIRRFGLVQPILIDESNNILSGHARVQAASEIGLTKVPCLVIDYMDDIEKRAYVIADNKLPLNAQWNKTLLAIELEGLLLEGLSSSIDATGFSFEEVDLLIQQPGTRRTPDR